MKSLNYLTDHILYEIFKIILNISEKHGENSFNPLIRIYINIIENGIMYKIKTGFYLKLWTSGSMKLLESARIKINKDNNGENLSARVKSLVCI